MTSQRPFLFIVLILLLSTIFSCKKDHDKDSCDSNQSRLKVSVYSWGSVKHAVPDGVIFEKSSVGITPAIELENITVTYTDVHITVDGIDYFPPDSIPYVELDSLSVGTHDMSISTSCEKQIFHNDISYCQCTGDERYAELALEVIEPAYVVFDSLLFSQSLGCSWDFPGNGCPELDFDFQFYDQDLVIPIFQNYDTSDIPIEFAMGDTIAIYPSTCSFKLYLSDWDQFGDAEAIDQWTLDNNTMGNWQTGLHTLDSGISFHITRLD